jgi:6-pyruvoyltetrahydropterin/6-carboxytetrahydropterin synthase
MHQITRRLEIDMGHRLLAHEGKCANYHGHRYVFDITCAAEELDGVGRVVDFSVVKELVGGWLDANWDHGMILQSGDPLIQMLTDVGSRLYVVRCSPTAENLARLLCEQAATLLKPSGVRVVGVRCWETPNCWADHAAPAPSTLVVDDSKPYRLVSP